MTSYTVEPLTPQTWDAYARLMERHNGVFGGCWCTYFQTLRARRPTTPTTTARSSSGSWTEGRAHAALVVDGDEAVAWAQYGSPAELPNIYHRKEYEEAGDAAPDYRITCIFVDKTHRRRGVTELALRGALDLIGQAGGGVVEGYPHDTTDGRKVSVLYDGTRALYERVGFDYVRPKGLRNCVMRTTVPG